MRKVLIAVAAVAVFVIGVSVASDASGSFTASSGSGPVLFRDYFNDSTDSNWTFYNRHGRIADGRLWIDGGYQPNSIARDGWALTHAGDAGWRNYNLDVTYDSTNATGYPSYRHTAFVYIRVASTNGNALGTWYIIDVTDPGTMSEGGCAPYGQPYQKGEIALSKVVDGRGTGVANTCASNTITGTNAVRVVVQGNTITVIANGMKVLSYRDPSAIAYGGVGVGQLWETNGWFDNVIVTRLSDSGAPNPRPGNAKLIGIPMGCVRTTFPQIRGARIASVIWALDSTQVRGRTVHRGTRYAASIPLSPGSHRLAVKVTFITATHTRVRTFHRTVSGCPLPPARGGLG